MKKTAEGILLSEGEARDIIELIDRHLDGLWDRHTSFYICTDSQEEGKRRMNKEAYTFMQNLQHCIWSEE